MQNEEFKIKTINFENIDNEHICCAIGDDKINTERAKIKKAWMKERFKDGYTFKKIDVRGKVFIEYSPVEKAWYAVEGDGYNIIQCFWASGRYHGQGLGGKLLEECEKDSKDKNGVVVISTNKKMAFMNDKKFFIHKGYKICDTAQPYFELLVKKFNKNASDPQFSIKAKSGYIPDKKGLTFFYTDMCPFVNSLHLDNMIGVAEKMGIIYEKIKIDSLDKAKNLPSPSGIFNVFYDGIFLTHEMMLENKFEKFLKIKLKI